MTTRSMFLSLLSLALISGDELIRQDGLYRRIYEIQSSYAETEAEYEPDPV